MSCGSHMTHLDLSHNQLISVQGLGSLSNLEELKLASNKLSCPPDLGRCRKVNFCLYVNSSVQRVYNYSIFPSYRRYTFQGCKLAGCTTLLRYLSSKYIAVERPYFKLLNATVTVLGPF